jgi:4-diphosphocytidyl-2-C-methyl-D-erythritol kinase
MTGRGDVLEQRFGALDAPVVLAKPAEPVPTAAAYAAFDRLAALAPSPDAPNTAVSFALRSALDAGDVREVADALANTMTPASVSLVPTIGDALALVSGASGVLGAEMAGSGSTVFGICTDDETAMRVAALASAGGYWAAATRLSPAGCSVHTV